MIVVSIKLYDLNMDIGYKTWWLLRGMVIATIHGNSLICDIDPPMILEEIGMVRPHAGGAGNSARFL